MAVRLSVRLTPRGGRDAVDGVTADGVLRIRVAAPPVDGAANEALTRFVADQLGVAASSVRIEAGATSRVKRLVVDGVDAPLISARWPGIRMAKVG